MIEIDQKRLISSFSTTEQVKGLTHNFYRYPARFAPEFAREFILQYSRTGDCILDAFMGGGTAIVEAVANGRYALGIDINPIAHFVTKVKTTPLSAHDEAEILLWVDSLDFSDAYREETRTDDLRLKNIPAGLKPLLAHAVSTTKKLKLPRQRNFASCALLKLGQWAIDCRSESPTSEKMKKQLQNHVEGMLQGLDSFVQTAKQQKIPKNKITSRRLLYLGNVSTAIAARSFSNDFPKPKLVITSPPYPGVHVLYHRWQVNGRRETPAPYLLAGLKDGHGESYYTLGGRSTRGLNKYFTDLSAIFRAIHTLIHEEALIIQLVAFSDPDMQLPALLDAMNLAGYEELTPFEEKGSKRPTRRVPNRKWYTSADKKQHASNEILLFHRPVRN